MNANWEEINYELDRRKSRILELEAEVERVIEERRLALNKVAGLEAENTRLKAPVGPEEWEKYTGQPSTWHLRRCVNALIASRATRTPQADKEEK
jgi:hypothetical protein